MWNLIDYGEDVRVRATPNSEAQVSLKDSLLSIEGVQMLLQYRDINDSLQRRGTDTQRFVRETLLDFMRDQQKGAAHFHASPAKDKHFLADTDDAVYRIIASRKRKDHTEYDGQR